MTSRRQLQAEIDALRMERAMCVCGFGEERCEEVIVPGRRRAAAVWVVPSVVAFLVFSMTAHPGQFLDSLLFSVF